MQNSSEKSNTLEEGKALAERCLPFYSTLFHYATFLTRDEDKANDLVQATFLRILRASGNFESDNALKSWMINIMRNLFFDQRRMEAARKTFLVDDIDSVAPANHVYEEVIFNQSDHARIAGLRAIVARACIRALNCVENYLDEIDQAITGVIANCFSKVFMSVYIAMPLRDRVIFALATIFDYSYTEIMDILGLSEATMKSRLFHARNRVHRDQRVVNFARTEFGLAAKHERSSKRPRANGRAKAWY